MIKFTKAITTKKKLWSGIGFIGLSLLTAFFTYSAYISFSEAWKAQINGVKTKAKILECSRGTNSTSFEYEYTAVLESGEKKVYRNSLQFSPPGCKEGQEITIYYTKNEPSLSVPEQGARYLGYLGIVLPSLYLCTMLWDVILGKKNADLLKSSLNKKEERYTWKKRIRDWLIIIPFIILVTIYSATIGFALFPAAYYFEDNNRNLFKLLIAIAGVILCLFMIIAQTI